MPLIPIAITLGTLGTLYATRGPVRELRQGKRYRLGVVVNARAFVMTFQEGERNYLARVAEQLQAIGFANPVYRSDTQREPGPGGMPNDYPVFWFDATWASPESNVSTPPASWIAGISPYALLF